MLCDKGVTLYFDTLKTCCYWILILSIVSIYGYYWCISFDLNLTDYVSLRKLSFVGTFSWTIIENLLVCGYDVSDVEVNTHVCHEAYGTCVITALMSGSCQHLSSQQFVAELEPYAMERRRKMALFSPLHNHNPPYPSRHRNADSTLPGYGLYCSNSISFWLLLYRTDRTACRQFPKCELTRSRSCSFIHSCYFLMV